jgi:hypothetical protein
VQDSIAVFLLLDRGPFLCACRVNAQVIESDDWRDESCYDELDAPQGDGVYLDDLVDARGHLYLCQSPHQEKIDGDVHDLIPAEVDGGIEISHFGDGDLDHDGGVCLRESLSVSSDPHNVFRLLCPSLLYQSTSRSALLHGTIVSSAVLSFSI